MVTIYVIQSEVNFKLYVGMTQDLQRRLKEHNSGKSKFTSAFVPWKIIYSEEQPDFTSARVREKYLKSASGKRFLSKMIQPDFHSGNMGSLPD
jgi:putative endonuclease